MRVTLNFIKIFWRSLSRMFGGSMERDEKHVHLVFDAIHKTMTFKHEDLQLKCIREINDEPCFQRLKGIKQLGFLDIVFPTATHSRFSHALGTAFLCSRIIKNISPDLGESKKKKIKETIVASLLHDIGHGPFSHAFEEFLKDYIKLKINHEKWAYQFLKKKYKKVLEKEKLDINNIYKLISSSKRKEKNCHGDVYSDLVSSQLDADRLDYLLRDSYFCGVEYGNYDLVWLLSCFCVYSKDKHKNMRLAVRHKGIGALESYLINRRLMHQNIYHHKIVKGFDHYFKFLMIILTEQIEK